MRRRCPVTNELWVCIELVDETVDAMRVLISLRRCLV